MKKVISGLIVFILLYTGFTVYFAYYHPVAADVRQSVHQRLLAEQAAYLPFSQIPKPFQSAIIDTEDRRFYQHFGIDPRGVLRALFTDTSSDQLAEGGSTITQQLVRNTLLTLQKTWTRKLKEVVLSLALEQNMSKQEIFECYANDIYFGHGAYGAGKAALIYFGKPLEQCSEAEWTLLAGIPNAPSDYDPLVNFTLSKERQRVVLQNMVDNGDLTQAEAKQIYSQQIHLKNSKS